MASGQKPTRPQTGGGQIPEAFASVPASQGIDFDFTLQIVSNIQKDQAKLTERIDNVIRQINVDRISYREDVSSLKSDLRSDLKDLKDQFKEFNKEDFKPLRTDVTNLKLQWAKVAGVAVSIGVILTFLGEIIKSHL